MTFRRGSRRMTPELSRQSSEYYAAMAGKAPVDLPSVLPTRKPRAPRQKRERSLTEPPLERDILKAVWKLLAHHAKVAWVSRFNNATFAFDDGGNQRWVRSNYKRGLSDLVGQMKDGRILCCEVKRPGEALMDHQRDFLNEVRSNGGVAFVARSVEDAYREIA